MGFGSSTWASSGALYLQHTSAGLLGDMLFVFLINSVRVGHNCTSLPFSPHHTGPSLYAVGPAGRVVSRELASQPLDCRAGCSWGVRKKQEEWV